MQRREFLVGGSALGAAAAINASPSSAQVATPNAAFDADLALINGNIITLDSARPRAQAALVRAGKIIAVGSTAEIRGAAGAARVFDASGRTVIPGFVDNHCHVEWSCMAGDFIPSLWDSATIEDMIGRVRAEAAKTPKGQWVVLNAWGFPDNVAEKRWMTREDLDRASTDHPIMILLGIHASIMNTRAFQQSGYWDAANEMNVRWADGSPRRGSVIHRDAQGRPTGVASEVWDLLGNRYSTDQFASAMRRHFKEWFTAKGLTSITTLPTQMPEQVQALQLTSASGDLPARMRFHATVPHGIGIDALTKVGWMSGHGDTLLRFGGVKIFVDNGDDGKGRRDPGLKWVGRDLERTLVTCQQNGLQTILHVVTPEGMQMTLDAIEAARRATPGVKIAHRIDHLTPTSIEQIRRLKALNVGVGITAPNGRLPVTGPSRGYSRAHRYRTLLNEGVATCLVLDAAGPGGNYHPMRGVANVMTDVNQGGGVVAGEAVTLEEALRMWTVVPAQMNGDHDRGVIQAGKLGDFTVLSADPATKPAAEIYDIQTVATIVGGKLVHGA